MRDTRDSFENFDRNFKLMQRVIFAFIALVFVLVIGIWCATAYFAVNVGPAGIGRMLGQIVNGYHETTNH